MNKGKDQNYSAQFGRELGVDLADPLGSKILASLGLDGFTTTASSLYRGYDGYLAHYPDADIALLPAHRVTSI